MPQEIFLPRLSQTMDSGRIAEFLKAPGEKVAKGEILVIVESDKSAVELEAEVDGVLGPWLKQVDDEVAIGTTLGWIALEGEDPAGLPSAVAAADAAVHDADERLEPSRGARASVPPAQSGAGRLSATPVARRLAAEHGIELTTLAGTGPDGRIGKEDVLSAIAARTVATPSEAGGSTINHAGLRKIVAARMATSARNSVPVALAREVDMTAVEALCKRGSTLTFTNIVAWCLVRMLVEHPALNGWVYDDRVELAAAVDLGLAVAAPNGLLVPTIRNAERMDLATFASACGRAASIARSGRLDSEHTARSSVSVSSLGGEGVDFFAPVINPPEITILGIGRAARRAVIVGDAIEARLTALLTLVFDHRALDGRDAALALAALAGRLEAGDFV